VLEVRSHSLLVAYGDLRFKVPSTPAARRDHWIGQRIAPEVSDGVRPRKSVESPDDPGRWAWLDAKPHGTLVEGRVVGRMRQSVLVDFGHGCLMTTDPGPCMRTVHHLNEDGCLPRVGETLMMSFHGFRWNGTPRLYRWLHEVDPKYQRFDAGYRSRYRGEDGCFARLPWESPESEPADCRRARWAQPSHRRWCGPVLRSGSAARSKIEEDLSSDSQVLERFPTFNRRSPAAPEPGRKEQP
jgi:hypothetical protein